MDDNEPLTAVSGPYLPIERLEHRRVYEIRARNLRVGVWDEQCQGFVGIRRKFNDLYLDIEYHWDTGTGTARPTTPTKVIVPDTIALATHLGTVCDICQTTPRWVPNDPEKGKYPGRNKHEDPALDADHDAHGNVVVLGNPDLFNLLKVMS